MPGKIGVHGQLERFAQRVGQPTQRLGGRLAAERQLGLHGVACVDDAEREAVESALRACDGSRERAAEALDISPTTLWRKMTRLAISFEDR